MTFARYRHCALAIGLLCLGQPGFAQSQADADASYAAEDWPAAVRAYEALLAGDPASGRNWYNLARAAHRAGELARARAAYERSIEAGFRPVSRTRYHLARAYMALGDRENALAQLELVAQAGGPTNRTLQGTVEFESLDGDPRYEAVLAELTPCHDPIYRHFDFWIGEWDVTAAGAPTATASSSITAVQDGCVILEQYQAGPYTGMSLSFYDSVTGRWHQTWMSNSGGAVYMEGGLDEAGAMVLTDADLPVSTAAGSINRVTWSANSDGSVRQYWEVSSDGGESWSVSFDGHYTPRAVGTQ
jgi:FimV-like protein